MLLSSSIQHYVMMESSFSLHANADVPPAQIISSLYMQMICQGEATPTLGNSGALLINFCDYCCFIFIGVNTYTFFFPLFRSNFLGTKFTIYDGQPPHAGAKITKSRSTRLVNLKQVSPKVPTGNYPIAHISYELNVLGSR